MRKYIQYFKALKMRKDLSGNQIYEFMLVSFLTIILSNFIFSGLESFSVLGPSFILFLVIFAAGFSQAETLTEPDILLALPWTAKERVRFYYVHMFVLFIIAYSIFIALIFLFIGVVWIASFYFDGIEMFNNDDTGIIHYAGDLYSLAMTMIQIALYTIIGFIQSVKKRYGWFVISTGMILGLHILVLSVFAGNLGIYSAYDILSPSGSSVYFTVTLCALGVSLIYGSYRYVLNKQSYQ